MAIRQIRLKDDPVLRKQTRTVEKFDDKLAILIDDMFETMYRANGVGLAAPQVGILKKVVVIDVGEDPIVLVNPEIIETKGKEIDSEGCLSIPGFTGKVERPKVVKAKGLDKEGKEIVVTGKGLLARAICHEIDHLSGILFTDKVIDDVISEDEE